MSKRNLLNLTLFIFILVLVIFVVYEPGKQEPVTPPTLTNLEINDIQHIKIHRRMADKTEQDIAFKKTIDGWVMLKPYQLAANTFRINSILKLLSSASLSQNDLKNLDQNKFDLNIPHATITFNNKTKIEFGHNKSLNHHRYVKIGSTLHMVTDTYFYQLNAKAESYISHKLLNKNNKIIKLNLPNLKLKQTNEKWEVTPKENTFTADSVNRLISEWQLTQAYDVSKIKPTGKSKADITVYLDNNEIIRFNIEANKGNFNLINLDSGIRYILSADRKNKLLELSNIEQNDE
jgi:hypothetical protein